MDSADARTWPPPLWGILVGGGVVTFTAAVLVVLSSGAGCTAPWDIASHYGDPRPGFTILVWSFVVVWLALAWVPVYIAWHSFAKAGVDTRRPVFWWRVVRAALYAISWIGMSAFVPLLLFRLPAGSDGIAHAECVPGAGAAVVLVGAIAFPAALLVHLVMWMVAVVAAVNAADRDRLASRGKVV